MTKEIEAPFYFSGVADYDGECQRVSDEEAQFWTVYERTSDGISSAICDCHHRDDVIAATERFNDLTTALEKSQQYAKDRDTENQALMLTVGRLRAERDALREQELHKATNTRAAADIYFQLIEECEIPPGGSLVQHVEGLKDKIAELEASQLAVKLPELGAG